MPSKVQAGNYRSVFSNSSLSDVTLMLLGKTGAGKSSIGNAIMSKLSGEGAFTVTDDLYSTAIYEAVAKEAHAHDRLVKVVDTPGVKDTNKDGGEERALQGICEGISRCSEGVDAFLIVLRLDVRFTDEEFESIAKLEKLFGQHFWRFVILVVTHGDSVQNDASTFQQKLAAAQEHIPQFKELMSKLTTKPRMIDASLVRQPDVVAKQIKGLMNSVDMLVSANKQKYTNQLFTIARAELAARKNAELEKEHREATSQLTSLKKTIAELEATREEDKKKMQSMREEEKKKMESREEEYKKQVSLLEQRARTAESQLEPILRAVLKIMVDDAKKNCTIS